MGAVSDYTETLYGGKPPYRRRRQQDTSRAAALTMLATATTLQAKVYQMIQSRTDAGMTDEEIQEALSLRIPTEVARRRELVLLGVIEDSGRRRQNESGRDAIVWWVVPERTQLSLL